MSYLLYKFHYIKGNKVYRSFPCVEAMECMALEEKDLLERVEDLNDCELGERPSPLGS